MRRTILRAAPVVALAGAAAVIAGGSPADAKSPLRLKAVEGDGLSFSNSRLTTSAGKVTIVMDNPGSNQLPHAVAIKGKKGRTAQPGETSRVTVKLKKGTYTYFCPIEGHRKAGMKGKIVVKG